MAARGDGLEGKDLADGCHCGGCDLPWFQRFMAKVTIWMKVIQLVVGFVTIIVVLSAHGQSLPPDVTAKVDKVFEKWNTHDSPGCALGVYQSGQIAYMHGYGMANLNDDIPITPATVFHVASMSKQFTAASILLLAQQGKLSLDDDVHKYIPELPDFGERITLRHLMHHTSGLRDQWALLGLAGWRYSQDLITDDDVISMTVWQALNFKPGEIPVQQHRVYASGNRRETREWDVVSGIHDEEYF